MDDVILDRNVGSDFSKEKGHKTGQAERAEGADELNHSDHGYFVDGKTVTAVS